MTNIEPSATEFTNVPSTTAMMAIQIIATRNVNRNVFVGVSIGQFSMRSTGFEQRGQTSASSSNTVAQWLQTIACRDDWVISCRLERRASKRITAIKHIRVRAKLRL